jgi:hypothetical protein
MDEQQRKAMLKATFDTVSSGYDGGALRFFPKSAQSMVSLLDLRAMSVHSMWLAEPGTRALRSHERFPTGM